MSAGEQQNQTQPVVQDFREYEFEDGLEATEFSRRVDSVSFGWLGHGWITLTDHSPDANPDDAWLAIEETSPNWVDVEP